MFSFFFFFSFGCTMHVRNWEFQTWSECSEGLLCRSVQISVACTVQTCQYQHRIKADSVSEKWRQLNLIITVSGSTKVKGLCWNKCLVYLALYYNMWMYWHWGTSIKQHLSSVMHVLWMNILYQSIFFNISYFVWGLRATLVDSFWIFTQ